MRTKSDGMKPIPMNRIFHDGHLAPNAPDDR